MGVSGSPVRSVTLRRNAARVLCLSKGPNYSVSMGLGGRGGRIAPARYVTGQVPWSPPHQQSSEDFASGFRARP